MPAIACSGDGRENRVAGSDLACVGTIGVDVQLPKMTSVHDMLEKVQYGPGQSRSVGDCIRYDAV